MERGKLELGVSRWDCWMRWGWDVGSEIVNRGTLFNNLTFYLRMGCWKLGILVGLLNDVSLEVGSWSRKSYWELDVGTGEWEVYYKNDGISNNKHIAPPNNEYHVYHWINITTITTSNRHFLFFIYLSIQACFIRISKDQSHNTKSSKGA